MIRLELAKRIKAPADDVWKLISGSELRNLALGDYVESIVGDGPEGVGCVFTTTLKNGVRIRERIEGIDNVERELTYRVIDSGPMTYAYHRAVMRVQPCGDNECLYSTWCDAIVETGTEEKTKEAWLATNTQKAQMIADYFEKK